MGGVGPTLNPLTISTATAPGGTGGLSGTYRYVASYYDSLSGFESAPSAERTITVNNQGVVLTVDNIPTRYSRIRFYRTLNGGTTLLYLHEINKVGTSATYTDWGTLSPGGTIPKYENTPPPNAPYTGQ